MNIQFHLSIGSTPTNATSVVFRDPTDTYGVRREDTLATVVAAGTPLTHTGTGEYEYTFTDPEPNVRYTYWIEWVYQGQTYRYQQSIGTTGESDAYVNVPEPLPRSCISLARYAKLTGYSECAIMGVNHPSEAHGDCENPIWTQFQRDTLLDYFAEAQEEIEGETGYPLCPTYFVDEEHPYGFPVHARWKKILAAGVRASADILASAAIDYESDPALIGPVATSVTDPAEVKVFYPGSDREIEPLKISLSGGVLRVWIPRCRLVTPDSFATPEGGLEYGDLDNFLATVDVRRVYTDGSVNAKLVYAHRSSASPCASCGCLTCGEYAEDACLRVENAQTGALGALAATYSGGNWTARCRTCWSARPTNLRVSYLAGMNPISLQAEQAVLRLAHAKMPEAPCGCGPLKDLWARDTRVPEFIDQVRIENPFGPSDGALVAYRFAHQIKLHGAGAL